MDSDTTWRTGQAENKRLKALTEMAPYFRKHKRRILKATHHYSRFKLARLLADENIMRERKRKSIQAELSRETLSKIINIDLKYPIEAYLVLNHSLTEESLFLDVRKLGMAFFRGSSVDFAGIADSLKDFTGRLKSENVVLNQLAILKAENPDRYADMIRTGLLNYSIESGFTGDEKKLRDSFLAGLLHDIGFLYMDGKYNGKGKGRFTIRDLKEMQSHTELGYLLLKPWFNEDIANAALNHHRGLDDSGYPRVTDVKPGHLSHLTCFSSAFIACLRKYDLEKATKIQEIYSRGTSLAGDRLRPFFDRAFYQVMVNLQIQFNRSGRNIDLAFNKRYAVMIHNYLLYIHDLGHELKKLDVALLRYIRDKAAHRLELQNDVDDVFDHIKKIGIIIYSCGESPGVRQLMNDSRLVSQLLGDIEIISMELYRINRFFLGLFSYLNAKLEEDDFYSGVYKKALAFSHNVQRNISEHIDQDISIFDQLRNLS